nr:phosphoribosylanthranilate isomerase [Caldicoprobacter faecalis]
MDLKVVKIKICGLKRYQDIDYVNELKVDYAGFVFAKSPRRVDLQHAERLIARLDKGIRKVGVFVNQSREFIKEACSALGLDVVQLHGDETPDEVAAYAVYGVEMWKAIRVKGEDGLVRAGEYRVDGILLDAAVQGRYGGTGQTFDWGLLEGVSFNSKLILAGGLNSHNVCSAIARVKPYAVDVSSGVETGGFKDYKKMKEFVERVRSFEKHNR